MVGFVQNFLLQHAASSVDGRALKESRDVLRQNKLSFSDASTQPG